jgi:hypothetical protein
MPGHGLTGAGGVIFVGAGGEWWNDFPGDTKRVSWMLDMFERSKRLRLDGFIYGMLIPGFRGLRGFPP